MICIFIGGGGGRWVCSVCGRATPAARNYGVPPVRACQRPAIRISDADHAARLAACQACDQWIPDTDRCRLLRGCDLGLKRRLKPDVCKRHLWPPASTPPPQCTTQGEGG